jgi:NAD(P)-dependent dehydrogenase (short-subunit alcohol dehydrogenase family)
VDFGLKNKKALVTGSTVGIGYAIAKALMSEGTTVYINGRTKGRVQDAITNLKKENLSGECFPAVFDLTTKGGTDELIKAVPEIDILVNNLGIYGLKAFEDIQDEDWLNYFEINVLSGIRLSRYYFPKMINKNSGRIVFISSESGINIPSEMIHYGVTKTAQIAVARGLSELTKETGVTVNSVLPGPTMTEGVETFTKGIAKEKGLSIDEAGKEIIKNLRPTSLIQRFATADEVAALVLFVCSSQASAINGAALRVEGGLLRSIV